MNQRLFEIETSSSEILLVYSAANNSMPAKELGEAIIGMEECLKETAKIGTLYYEGINIEPIEPGSIKTKLVYIKKHPFQVIVGIGVVAALFNDSFQIIDRFGANNLKNPTSDILEQITERKVLDLCRSFDFRNGLQKVAQPINEVNQKVQIIINNKILQITCENKYQFYIDKQDEPILPELINGQVVVIDGEITRINKKLNDLGFIFKGYTLNVSPLDKDKNTVKFHEFLELDKVRLRGIVIRDSYFEVPKIKVSTINSIDDSQIMLPLGDK
jgi:hypothetical protein